MITYYTALGRLVTRAENETRIPVVIIDDSEYHMSIDELMIWGSLHWNFLNKEDLQREYENRKQNAHIFNDISFEQTLNRLEVRGIVKSETDYLAADALYGLVSRLRIKPIENNLLDKLKCSSYMYFSKGLPFRSCIKTFFKPEISESEKNILKLSKNASITTAEIIRCMESGVDTINDDNDIIDKLYADESTTEDNIITESRFGRLKTEILQSVLNLYLKKRIIFEY